MTFLKKLIRSNNPAWINTCWRLWWTHIIVRLCILQMWKKHLVSVIFLIFGQNPPIPVSFLVTTKKCFLFTEKYISTYFHGSHSNLPKLPHKIEMVIMQVVRKFKHIYHLYLSLGKWNICNLRFIRSQLKIFASFLS